MKILARPGTEIGDTNPYTRLLYRPIRDMGHTVDEFRLFRAFARRYDVLHFHWPEYYIANPNPLKAVMGTLGTLLVLRWARARGTRIVWTSHNLESHHGPHPRMEKWFLRVFSKSLDGLIAMSESGREETRQAFPHLRTRPCFVIPHGNYRDEYPNDADKCSARAFLRIPKTAKVICFLGAIAPYKGLLQLVDVFRDLHGEDLRLVIAGACDDRRETKCLRRRTREDSRIRLDVGYVPREHVQYYLNAADLVTLPFRKTWNSGSAILALSFDRPILVPGRGAFVELQSQVGAEWIRTFEGELTANELEGALDWAIRSQRAPRAPLEGFEWSHIAEETIGVYAELMKSGTRDRIPRDLQESHTRIG